MHSEQNGIELARLIRKIHTELLTSESLREQEGLRPLFAVRECSLEVQFVVTKRSSVEGQLDLKLIALDKDSAYETQSVHKILLTLVPFAGSSHETYRKNRGEFPSQEDDRK